MAVKLLFFKLILMDFGDVMKGISLFSMLFVKISIRNEKIQMRFISLAIKPAFAIAIMEPEERYNSLNGAAR